MGRGPVIAVPDSQVCRTCRDRFSEVAGHAGGDPFGIRHDGREPPRAVSASRANASAAGSSSGATAITPRTRSDAQECRDVRRERFRVRGCHSPSTGVIRQVDLEQNVQGASLLTRRVRRCGVQRVGNPCTIHRMHDVRRGRERGRALFVWACPMKCHFRPSASRRPHHASRVSSCWRFSPTSRTPSAYKRSNERGGVEFRHDNACDRRRLATRRSHRAAAMRASTSARRSARSHSFFYVTGVPLLEEVRDVEVVVAEGRFVGLADDGDRDGFLLLGGVHVQVASDLFSRGRRQHGSRGPDVRRLPARSGAWAPRCRIQRR